MNERLGWFMEQKRGLRRAPGYVSLLPVHGAILLLPSMHQLRSKNHSFKDPGILLRREAVVKGMSELLSGSKTETMLPGPHFHDVLPDYCHDNSRRMMGRAITRLR